MFLSYIRTKFRNVMEITEIFDRSGAGKSIGVVSVRRGEVAMLHALRRGGQAKGNDLKRFGAMTSGSAGLKA